MSININSKRSKKLELLASLDFHQPQIVAIQETTRIYVYEIVCPNQCEPSIEVIVKMGVQRGVGGQAGFERRIEVIVEIQKNRGGGGGGGGPVLGCQGGCERRIEVIVKMQTKKKMSGGGCGRDGRGSGLRVRADVNEKLNLL